MKPLYSDIKKGDYFEPIKRLSEYYIDYNDYYKNLLKYSDISKLPKKDSEEVLLKYLECRPNARITVSFNKSVKPNKNTNNKLIYKKIIKIDNDNIYHNLLHQIKFIHMYQNISIPDFLLKKSNKKIIIYVYFYEGEEIKSINSISNNNFLELVMYSRIFLNDSNLIFFESQSLKETINNFSIKSKCYNVFNKFINYFYSLSLLEQNNLVLKSGIVLFTHGIRTCSDIDLLYVKDLNKSKNKSFDIREINSKNQELFYPYGKPISESNVLLDPIYHYYFYGVKIITMDVEMRLRSTRINRPRAFVDIIMVNELLSKNYKLPNLDLKSNKFPIKSMEQFYKSLDSNFRMRYQKNYTLEEIKNLLNKYK